MKKYIEKIKSNKKVLYISIVILILFIGVSFAYVVAQLSGGDFKLFNLNADTTDQLEFNVDKDISLSANQFNFAEGAGNLSDQAVATARLKANSTKNTATYTYNVYLLIDKNEFKYTTSDKKTEILLQVTDPNGNNLTELSDLKYDSILQGFDITEVNDELIRIAEEYEITSNSSANYTEQTWAIKVLFINLDTNQKANAGKALDGKLLIQKNKINDLTITANNIPSTYGALANMNCTGNDAVYNYKYNEINVRSFNSTGSKCTINYTERTNKEYLNNKIIGLSGTTRGTGQIVNETFVKGNFTNATTLSQTDYGITSQYYNSYAASAGGTTVANAFAYIGDEWVSQPSNMTSNKYYYISFTVPTTGAYQLCYELSSGSASNRLYVYKETATEYINGSAYLAASSSSTKSGCIDLGYVSSGTLYRVAQRAYTTISTLKFSIKKAGSTSTINTGYRYEGKDPNNWVWFNNELWRIIGVFDSETHGVANTNLVKIIRANQIGGLAWHNSFVNDWSAASLKKLLNTIYYNKRNGNGSTYCYTSEKVPGNCDYSNIGIDASYRSMIKQVTWKLGGHSTTSATAETLYNAERGTTVYSGRPTTWSGYIGLMYPSDYGYSVLSSSCARTTNLGSYDTSACAGQSWLNGNGNEWTLTPRSSYYAEMFCMTRNELGICTGQYGTYAGLGVRPSLYLEASVYVIDGTGTESNPYIIGM